MTPDVLRRMRYLYPTFIPTMQQAKLDAERARTAGKTCAWCGFRAATRLDRDDNGKPIPACTTCIDQEVAEPGNDRPLTITDRVISRVHNSPGLTMREIATSLEIAGSHEIHTVSKILSRAVRDQVIRTEGSRMSRRFFPR